ncbi:MAG: type II toxin-antitoxin system VapC family toxin [Candidatus Acidiferrales bacterium]
MRLLLDTHALLWWIADDRSLPPPARRFIASASNEVMVSAVSAWEIATKVRLGKLIGAEDLAGDFAGFLLREGFEQLPISIEHGLRAGLLTGPNKDPFDRMLVAQCQSENLPILSNDRIFDYYNVRRLW